MAERSMSEDGYRFGFNGKENDRDFGDGQLVQDYGFRVYNPALGKFLSFDPLFSGYPFYTPYQFAGNKVINSIDLDGLEDKVYWELKRYEGRFRLFWTEEWTELKIKYSTEVTRLDEVDVHGKRIGLADELGAAAEIVLKEGARNLTPAEEMLILMEGKDFDGDESSRVVAGGLLLMEVIPGSGKAAKILGKGAKNLFKQGKKLLKRLRKTKVDPELMDPHKLDLMVLEERLKEANKTIEAVQKENKVFTKKLEKELKKLDGEVTTDDIVKTQNINLYKGAYNNYRKALSRLEERLSEIEKISTPLGKDAQKELKFYINDIKTKILDIENGNTKLGTKR